MTSEIESNGIRVNPVQSPGLRTVFCAACVALILIAATYLSARQQFELTRFQQLIQQARLAESLDLGRQLLQSNPRIRVEGQSMRLMVRSLEKQVETLEAEIQALSRESQTSDVILGQARRLAMLDRTNSALILLDQNRDRNSEALNLKATIFETREDWKTALEAYQQSLALSGRGGSNPTDNSDLLAGQVKALQGIAYCQRKLGQYRAAERAYSKLLERAPSAATHFQLAQFYEDTQQTELARRHAKRALDLDPEQFTVPARELIRKLETYHFGCYGVYQKEHP